jgi:tRNA/tmRNA/rRNA uracil-C5-methylase (TrmA/RlmC/RlmD family)
VLLPESLWEGLSELGIEGLHVNFHPSAGNRVFSKEWVLARGRARSRSEGGLLHGPASFQQLLPELYQRALGRAEAFLAPGPGDAVVDLYSGLGASLLRWQARGARAIGVELSGEAVECARENGAAGILRGRCSDRIPQIDRWLAEAPAARRLVFANPPRTGLEPAVARWLAEELRPERIAYLSCSPGTLSRDLLALETSGYRVSKAVPFDFFPGTHHVETLALIGYGNDPQACRTR